MDEKNLTRREKEKRARIAKERKKNQRAGVALATVVVIGPLLLLLSMCGRSDGTPVNNLRDSGVSISNSDYKALCKTYRGEWGREVDPSAYAFTDGDMGKILATIEQDPSCQPDS